MMPPPPKIPLSNRDGSDLNVNSLPDVGLQPKEYSLPVTQAQGVRPTQTYMAIPQYDSTNSATIVQVVAENANRRYLKIVNNGSTMVELWTGVPPVKDAINQKPIPRGEVLFPTGGLVEVGERISAIYATSADGPSGLLIIEG